MFLELLLALFLACLLRWIYKLHSHSFPGPIGLPIIGSITLQSPDHHVLSSLHKTYGKTFQYSILGEDYICTMDTSLMKKVFRERENFPSSTHLRKALGHLTGPTMFLSEGKKKKRKKRSLKRGKGMNKKKNYKIIFLERTKQKSIFFLINFSTGKLWEARHQILRQFVTHQMIRENTSTIGSYVLQIFSFLKENQSINIGSLLHLFTFQVLGKILFNLNLNAIENQNLKIGETPILELPSVFNDGLMKRLNLPSFLWKFNSEIWKKEKNCFCELKKIFLNCVNEYLEDEKKNNFKNENRNDLLSILIKNSNLIQKDEETEKNQTTGKNEKIKKKETEKNENFEEYKKQNKTKTKGHNYSVNDILSELFSFFIAGETAHACQFLFYLISSNKKIQNKIQNEIDFLVQKNKKENEEFWIPGTLLFFVFHFFYPLLIFSFSYFHTLFFFFRVSFLFFSILFLFSFFSFFCILFSCFLVSLRFLVFLSFFYFFNRFVPFLLTFFLSEYENILDLKYMDRTIKECMRLFPIGLL